AFSCALLIEPFAVTKNAIMASTVPSRIRVARKETESTPSTAISSGFTEASPAIPARRTEISQPLPRQPGGRWGEEIEWPAESQRSKVQKPLDAPPQSSETGQATATTEAAKPNAPPQSSGTTARIEPAKK